MHLITSIIFRVGLISLILMLILEGFFRAALKVATKEGQADFATETARKLIEELTAIIETITGLL